MRNAIGCAVIGIGGWGKWIAAAIQATDGVELRAVVDASSERADAEAGRLGTRAYTSVEDALADSDVDAVAVTLPNDLHAPVAVAALSAGKHVLLEKPMALTVGDAEIIIDAAARNGRTLMLDHIHRFFEPLIEIHRVVAEGTLGEVQAVSVSRRDHLHRTIPWLRQRKRVGGMLYQSACHEYDFLRWLCGDAVEIYCQRGPSIIAHDTLDYPDAILSQIRFASGTVGQVWDCMTDPLMGYDGVVTGTEGSAWFDLYAARVRWKRFDGEVEERTWSDPDRWAPWAWMAGGGVGAGEFEGVCRIIAAFRDAVQTEGQPPITGEDGAKVVEMAQAGYLSIVSGMPRVLPLAPADRDRPTYLEVPEERVPA